MAFYPQLDALRAVAVLCVLIEHAVSPAAPDQLFTGVGNAGVRLFFVLSGFLITGILLRAPAPSLWANLRVFYARRALRIFPLACAALAVAFALDLPNVRAHGWWYLTYTSNWASALHGGGDPGLGHFWSLAVEEQFYTVWPLLVLGLPRRALVPCCLAAIVGSGLWRVAALAGGEMAMAYHGTRWDALLVGGLLALGTPTWLPRVGPVAALVALAGWWMPATWLAQALSEWAGIVASAWVVSLAVQGQLWAPLWLRAIGTRAYGIYVWHYLLLGAIPHVEQTWDVWLRMPEPGVGRLVYISLLTAPCVWASWRWIEAPCLRLKDRPSLSHREHMDHGSLGGLPPALHVGLVLGEEQQPAHGLKARVP